MDPDGTHVVQLTHLTGGIQQAYTGSWSPDGRQIVYHVLPVHSSKGLNQLFVMKADGGSAHQLTHLRSGTNPRGARWGPAR
jgi:Tol biopolymer transport system component